MKDIPIFSTEYGVASLLLQEVPYRQEAYIRVQDVQPEHLELLLEECGGFCRACGAERIYWTGAETDREPAITVLEMRGNAHTDPALVENLFPVTEQTVGNWRQIYNERMAAVDNAATLTARDEEKLLQSNGAYFVHHRGELLGIFWLEDTQLLALAAVVPGAGERVAHTMMSLAEGETLTLEVAKSNAKARKLYRKLGFLETAELRRWYLWKKENDK